MILFLENFLEERYGIYSELRKKYLVSVRSYEEREECTKPLATVYINPLIHQVHRIEEENTICVVVRKLPTRARPKWMHYINDICDIPKEIDKIINEKVNKKEGIEIFGVICFNDKQIAIDGSYVDLSTKELSLIRSLLHNKDKSFSIKDISYYLDFNGDESGTVAFINGINNKCRYVNRPPLLIVENKICSINATLIE